MAAVASRDFQTCSMRSDRMRTHAEWLLPSAEELWSRVQRQAAPRVARRIAVAGIHEGDGASTMAVALAHFLWRRLGKRVLLLDADLRHSQTQSSGLGPEGSLGLHGVLEGQCALEDVVFRIDPLGFHLLPAGRPADSPAALLTETSLGVVCLKLNPYFDYFVYDCPPLHAAPEAHVLMAGAESSVLVLKSGATLPENAAFWLGRVQEYGGTVGAVYLNGVKSVLPSWLRRWL